MTRCAIRLFRGFIAASCYLLIAFPLLVSAAEIDPVTLSWDGTAPAPDGYNMYQRVEGEEYDYNNPVNDEIITGTSHVVENLQQDVRYYFVVTAVLDDDESEDSNEIEFLETADGDRNDPGPSDPGQNDPGPVASISSSGTSSTDNPGSGCFIGTAISKE